MLCVAGDCGYIIKTLIITVHNAMQISDVSQCAQIELQERNALQANLIALVWYVYNSTA